MTVTYQTERIDDCFEACLALAREHQIELEDEPFDPDVSIYRKMEAVGAMQLMVARLDGVMVGYCVVFIAGSHHHRGRIVGQGDIYYLAPKGRRGWVGVHLIKRSLDALRAKGVRHFRFMTSHQFDAGPILRYLGFEATGTIYSMGP